MKYIAVILTLLTACWCQSAYAQVFYVVQDDDGYVNVRGEHGAIVDTLPEGAIVTDADEFHDWWDGFSADFWQNSANVLYVKDDKLYGGIIHSSRLKDISSFPEATNRDEIFDLLPPSAYDKLIELSLPVMRVYHDETTNSYYLTSGGRHNDSEASYGVLWVVKNGRYAGRHFYTRGVGGDDGIGGDYFRWLAARKGIPLREAYRGIEESDERGRCLRRSD